MKIPAIKGVIRRRVLLNYRIEPALVQNILPNNFSPKLVDGHAIAGICLIRLEEIRPKGIPGVFGLSSENSAHRIAVEWDDAEGRRCEGVFVPRRDTSSLINAFAGGRIFPGVHHRSRFTVTDRDGKIDFRVEANDHSSPLVELTARETGEFPEASVFKTLDDSSRFFEAGHVGYSARPHSCTLDGLRLVVPRWKVSPLKVEAVRSAFFDDISLFPKDRIQFDHALLMRDIQHEWHSEPPMTDKPGEISQRSEDRSQ